MIPTSLRPFVRKFRPYYFPYVYHGENLAQFSPEYFPKCISKQDVVLEVGAKRGAGTKFLSGLARFVYSFEPESLNYHTAKRFLRTCKNVELYHLAISDHVGDAKLLYNTRDAASPTLTGIKGTSYDKTERVSLRTIDSISFPLKPTALIVDCEGAELEVLRGARNAISNLNMILVETHPVTDGTTTQSSVIEELERYGLYALETKKMNTMYAGFRETWIIARRRGSG